MSIRQGKWSQQRRWRRWERRRTGRTVLLAGTGLDRWQLAPVRRWDRLLARWRALELDGQLAAGAPASTDRLRAVRAGMIVAPWYRGELAAAWENALGRVGGPWSVPLQRHRVVAAEVDIRRLIVALRVAQPVAARGVAIAELPLIDGTGPLLYGPSRVDLGAAVRAAIHHLDPCAAPSWGG